MNENDLRYTSQTQGTSELELLSFATRDARELNLLEPLKVMTWNVNNYAKAHLGTFADAWRWNIIHNTSPEIITINVGLPTAVTRPVSFLRTTDYK